MLFQAVARVRASALRAHPPHQPHHTNHTVGQIQARPERLSDTLHTFFVTGLLPRAPASKPGNQFIPFLPQALSFSKSTSPRMSAARTAFEKWLLIKITPQTRPLGPPGPARCTLFLFFFFFCRLQSGGGLALAKWRGCRGRPGGGRQTLRGLRGSRVSPGKSCCFASASALLSYTIVSVAGS